jgi:hypothetical protein
MNVGSSFNHGREYRPDYRPGHGSGHPVSHSPDQTPDPEPATGQMALFESDEPASEDSITFVRGTGGRPASRPDRGRKSSPRADAHLQAAQRLARRMRRLKDRSPEQTRAGLAICEQLKAYLRTSH